MESTFLHTFLSMRFKEYTAVFTLFFSNKGSILIKMAKNHWHLIVEFIIHGKCLFGTFRFLCVFGFIFGLQMFFKINGFVDKQANHCTTKTHSKGGLYVWYSG